MNVWVLGCSLLFYSGVLADPYFTITEDNSEDADYVYRSARPVHPETLTFENLQDALAQGNELDDPMILVLDLSDCVLLQGLPHLVSTRSEVHFNSVFQDGGAASSASAVPFAQLYRESRTGLYLESEQQEPYVAGDSQENAFGMSSTTVERSVGLVGLKKLILDGCENIRILPDFSRLRNLNSLFCQECTALIALPQLPLLKVLNLSWCENIEDFSCLAEQARLEQLTLTGCEKLTDVNFLRFLHQLKILDCSDCVGITDISSIARLSLLRKLVCDGCKEIDDISFFRSSILGQLELVSFRYCPKICDISGLGSLPSLRLLRLRGQHEIVGLDSLGQLESLYLEDYVGLRSVACLRNLAVNLRALSLGGCSNLTDAFLLSEFVDLEFLDLGCCTSINDFSFLSQLHVYKLGLCGCKQLVELPDLSHQEDLQYLHLNGCTGLCCRLMLPTSLEYLDLSGLTLTTRENSIAENVPGFLAKRECGLRCCLKHYASIYNLPEMCPHLNRLVLRNTNFAKKVDRMLLKRAASSLATNFSIPFPVVGSNGGPAFSLQINNGGHANDTERGDEDDSSDNGSNDGDDNDDTLSFDDGGDYVDIIPPDYTDAREQIVRDLFHQMQEVETRMRSAKHDRRMSLDNESNDDASPAKKTRLE